MCYINFRSAIFRSSILQVNYLIDEAVNTGKGSNAIISMLHHFFETYGLGESSLQLHADNCSGQNKNRYMLEYLTWRVLAGLHDEVELSFLIVGHTKFSPDWCFGLFKRAFKRTKVGCLDDIASVCESSSKVNFAQLVGKQDGTPIVKTYDWGTYFRPFFKADPFKGIKKWHHLRFTKTKPGVCLVQTSPNSAVKELQVLRETSWKPSPFQLPPLIKPEGLPAERKNISMKK